MNKLILIICVSSALIGNTVKAENKAQQIVFTDAVNANNLSLAIAVFPVLDQADKNALKRPIANFTTKFGKAPEVLAANSKAFLDRVAAANTPALQKNALTFLFENADQPGRQVADKLGLNAKEISSALSR